MDVTPLVRKGQQIIQSYAGGRFKVSGTYYEGAVMVLPEGTVPWEAPGFDALQAQNFDFLIKKSDDLDVVLLGCGTEMKFLPSELKKSLKDKGLNIDVMDTGAACRTYNVLMAEGRRVAAALLPLENF
jgi:uncharacterized protein